MPGTLFVVATPIGNLEDISARAVRVLREVAIIAAEDTRRTAHLLIRYAIQTPTTSLNEHNEGEKGGALLARLQAGESVALVSDAGTPTVSDPGHHLVSAAIAAGIRVEPVPGASAPLALLSVSGLPSDTFAFLGFPPVKAEARKQWFDRLRRQRSTVVFFESPHRLSGTLEALRLLLGDQPIVIGRELTKLHEEVFRGTIAGAIAHFHSPVGEFVLALNLGESHTDEAVVEFSDPQIVAAYEERRSIALSSRRRAVQEVAKRLGLSPNRVYEAIERAKKSGS